MCNPSGIEFVTRTAKRQDVWKKSVIESGARDVNGSVRPVLMRFEPSMYVGTDIEMGNGVDVLCDAVDLVNKFGEASFDVCVSTEVVEHVQYWRAVIGNYKRILRPGGVLFLTTRSEGFGWHGYPSDYWRYSVEDMQEIFADFRSVTVESDPAEPGVFVKAYKPSKFRERDLSKYELYSINELKRIK